MVRRSPRAPSTDTLSPYTPLFRSVGIDGISLFLVVMSGLLFPLAMIAVTPHHDQKPYYAWLLLLQGACIGVFCALDLFVFFVMFELVLVRSEEHTSELQSLMRI